MKRFVFFVTFAIVLFPAAVLAGGIKEEPPAVAPAVDVELGAVINRQFDLIIPNDMTPEKRGGTVVIDRFKAAPMLREKVEAGELPPVDERLPVEPLVLEPIESIGKYGGWIRQLRFPAYLDTLSHLQLTEHLVTWTSPYFGQLNPNVAKAWHISADATVTTFFLREGMKWSDGTPFTADAIVWWFEHIIKNDDLHPSKPAFLLTRGNLPTVTKIDDTTIRFAFTDPNPMFIENAARIRPMPYSPAHYLEQFHPDFVSLAEIERLLSEEDYDVWMDMFRDKANFMINPDLPGVSGWIPLNPGTEEVARFGRNPYYWKVDSDGNQLPYIDGMDHPFVMDAEAWFLQALAGELTFARGAFIGGRPNLPLLLENRETGGYEIAYRWWPPNNMGGTFFNFGHPDEVRRELINDRRFRLALIKAIDYDEVNDVLFEGDALPSWPASSDHFSPDHELYRRYIGRDVDHANVLLDEMGLTARDRAGYRLGPDGRELTLIGVTTPAHPVETMEMIELYRGYFEEIGIRMVARVLSAQLAGQMFEAGEFDLYMAMPTPGGRPMNIYDRGMLMPAGRNWGISRPWARWLLSDGRDGIEPPDHVKRLREILETGMVESSAEVRDALIEEALEIWVENLLVIPGFNDTGKFEYFVFKENLRNFAIEGRHGYLKFGNEFHIIPSVTFYFE